MDTDNLNAQLRADAFVADAVETPEDEMEVHADQADPDQADPDQDWGTPKNRTLEEAIMYAAVAPFVNDSGVIPEGKQFGSLGLVCSVGSVRHHDGDNGLLVDLEQSGERNGEKPGIRRMQVVFPESFAPDLYLGAKVTVTIVVEHMVPGFDEKS